MWFEELLREWGAQIFGGTATGLIALKMFVFDSLSGKKVDRLMDFSSVAKKEFKAIGEIVTDGLDKFKKQLVAEVVTPLVQKSDMLVKENGVLANLVVQLISVSTLPYEQRVNVYKGVKVLSSINENVLRGLEVSLRLQEESTKQDSIQSGQLAEDIKAV
jgi:hypothetical protein